MLKILKSDFYRLFHSVMFWFFAMARGLSLFISIGIRIYRQVKGTGLVEEGAEAGCRSIFAIPTSAFSGICLIFICLCIVNFCGNERKNGFIKNVAGAVERKEYTVISKMIIGLFVTVVYFLEDWIFSISEWLIEGNAISAPEETGAWLSAYGTAFLINIAFVIFFILLMELTGASAIAYVAGFLLSCGIIDELIMGVFFAMRALFGWFEAFNVTEYLLMFNMSTFDSTVEHLGRFAVLSVIYMVVFGAVAVFVNKKKDVA